MIREYTKTDGSVKISKMEIYGKKIIFPYDVEAKFDICFDKTEEIPKVFLSPETAFAYRQSMTAAVKKLRRFAYGLHLSFGEIFGKDGICVYIYSRRDVNRFNELLKYINGSKMAKTAINNYGR